jgi:hypothetical protein
MLSDAMVLKAANENSGGEGVRLTVEHKARIEATCSRASNLIAKNERLLMETRRMLTQIETASCRTYPGQKAG